jgi:hypothetical protein
VTPSAKHSPSDTASPKEKRAKFCPPNPKLTVPELVTSEFLRSLSLRVSALGRFVSRGGVVVRYLRMLGSIRMFAFIMGISGFSMRFGSLFVVLGCFVMIVFWHFVS